MRRLYSGKGYYLKAAILLLVAGCVIVPTYGSRRLAEAEPSREQVAHIAEVLSGSFSPLHVQQAVISWEVEQLENLYRLAGDTTPSISVLKDGLLTFLWVPGHTLTTVHEFPDQASLDACDFSAAWEVKGPEFPHYYFLRFPEAGQRFFSCSYPGHCPSGMRLVVNVTDLSP
mmetsp:Transcript_18662/g.47157  ORF Transcript_18662/g.47157 Transcript_18662/m.47157 type:complete len:172 (-) Transcript_18662:324-839(-)|eukprot:jgi/Tetstr1/435191/TSEL_024111.t1